MASQDRTQADSLTLDQALSQAPFAFDFFQALRWVESSHPGQPRIGCGQRFSEDPIQLAQDPSLSFAATTLSSYRPGKRAAPPRLAVNFFGLLGPNGPLPIHLTEHARERLRNHHDPTFVRFLDIFHHRLLSLFYRSWASAQPTVSLDRPDGDRFADYVASTIGIGMPLLRHRDAVPDFGKLYYSGFLALQTRHADGLRSILSGYFGIKVDIDEFVGHWMDIPSEGQLCLGSEVHPGRLGEDTLLGSRMWDYQNKFRIVVGPMSASQYRQFLPGSRGLRLVRDWVRNYVGDALDWELNLVLKHDDVPGLCLGTQGELGWTSWLGADSDQPITTNADGVVTMIMRGDADDLSLRPDVQVD